MATWDKGRAEFTCPQCAAVYQCNYEDLPSRERGTHLCEDCGAVVHSWNGTRDYDDWELVRHGSKHHKMEIICQYCKKPIPLKKDESELQALTAHLDKSPLCRKAQIEQMPGHKKRPLKTGIKTRTRKN